MDLTDDKAVKYWVSLKGLAESTVKIYLNIMGSYCEFTGKLPNELIEEAEDEEIQGLRPRYRKVNNYLLDFQKQLKDNGKAPKTVDLYMNAVKSFYDANDIQVTKLHRTAIDNSLEQNRGKLLTKEEIRRMVDVAGPRERALIYTMALSGMAQEEARSLKIIQIIEAISKELDRPIKTIDELISLRDTEIENKVITLEIVRKKTHYRYITFLPPEALVQILSYLRERMHGKNEKIRIKNIKDPLFVLNNGRKLTRDSVVTNIRETGLAAGFEKENGAYSFWRAHAFRKYFISTIKNTIGDQVLAELLAGHKLRSIEDVYWYRDSEALRDRYLSALPHLSIDGAKVKDVLSKEYKILIKEGKERDEVIAGLKETLSNQQKKLELMEEKDRLREQLENDPEFQQDMSS